MNELRKLREGWAQVETQETELLRALSVAQSVRQYLALQREFEPLLQQTEATFRVRRNQAMINLQARLCQLNTVSDGDSMEHLVRSVVALQTRFARSVCLRW